MSRRLIGVFAAFLFLCSVCYFRVFALATSPQLKEAAGSQGSVSLTAVSGRGDIFDRNGEKLVNVAPAYKVVLTPEQALQNYILLKDEVDSTDALEAGMQGTKPFVLSLSRRLKDDSLLHFVDYSRYEDNQSAAHIVGYLNGGKGVSGIEKAYDSLLAEGGYTATVSMQVSGMGTVIEGRPPQVEERQGQASVTLTLDNDETVECAILTIFPVNGHDYIALLPLDENGENEDGEVYLYRYDQQDGTPVLDNIEDDEEYEAVADMFDQLLDAAEYDEMVAADEDTAEN